MSYLVGNPKDRFSRDNLNLFQSEPVSSLKYQEHNGLIVKLTGNTEVISISEDLSCKSAPLFADFTNLMLFVFRKHL